MRTEIMKIFDLSGEDSARRVKQVLQALGGVGDVAVSVTGGRAMVQFDENLTSPQELRATVARAGFSIDGKPAISKHGGSMRGALPLGSCVTSLAIIAAATTDSPAAARWIARTR